MKIVVCYIAVTNGGLTEDYCARFVTTYHEFPPGIEHETIVVSNGGPLSQNITLLFWDMNASMWPRENDPGWDITAYIAAARGPCADADMILCLGESVYFHREGWLKRLVDAWAKHGPGMYGPFASNLVRSHLNTTAFFTSPVLLRQSPVNPRDRYGWEHGEHSFWRWVSGRGMPVRLVTWDGEWEPRSWRSPPNILWRGNQSNCLMWCNHTDHYAGAAPRIKSRWANNADRPFK